MVRSMMVLYVGRYRAAPVDNHYNEVLRSGVRCWMRQGVQEPWSVGFVLPRSSYRDDLVRFGYFDDVTLLGLRRYEPFFDADVRPYPELQAILRRRVWSRFVLLTHASQGEVLGLDQIIPVRLNETIFRDYLGKTIPHELHEVELESWRSVPSWHEMYSATELVDFVTSFNACVYLEVVRSLKPPGGAQPSYVAVDLSPQANTWESTSLHAAVPDLAIKHSKGKKNDQRRAKQSAQTPHTAGGAISYTLDVQK